MDSGELRHRVQIDERRTAQDVHGDNLVTWVSWATNVPAKIAAISGKEFLAGQGIVGQATTRIKIRWRRGVVQTMRVRHLIQDGSPAETNVYNIHAVLPDKETGRDYLMLMCTEGVNEG